MGKMNETDLSMAINNKTYIDYLDRLKLLAVSLFKWKGLDDIAGFGASRFLEMSLYDNGRACFLKDEKLGYLALKVNPSDKLNVYNLPVKVLAWSIGYNKTYDFDDIVYIMNNELELPTSNTLSLFNIPSDINEKSKACSKSCKSYITFPFGFGSSNPSIINV